MISKNKLRRDKDKLKRQNRSYNNNHKSLGLINKEKIGCTEIYLIYKISRVSSKSNWKKNVKLFES